MKKQLLFAAISGVALISAAPPADPIPWEDEESLRNYPPCSATVTDRCIQGKGRGVAPRDVQARTDDAGKAGIGGPDVAAEEKGSTFAASDYPPCSATVTDKCIQTKASGRQTVQRMARTTAKPRQQATAPMRLAMRAGERG